MRIIELLLPKGTSDKSLSPQAARKIDALQDRMDSYVDKITDPKTSKAGKDFLKAKLKKDLEELKDILPEAIAESLREPVEWSWITENDRMAKAQFKVGKIPYIFQADLISDSHKMWSVLFEADVGVKPKGKLNFDKSGLSKFQLSQRAGETQTGNASSVFSTIISIMESFLNNHKGNVDKLKFAASPESRQRLYSHMINRLLPGAETDKFGTLYTVTLPHAVKDTKINEAVTKLPLSNDDFELVKKVMERPIPAAVASIYIHQIIEDDEFNDQLAALEESDPGMDVRPHIAAWFDRVMPDQVSRFTGDVQNYAQKNGVLSLIHGYDSHEYKGQNNPITGNAFGFR